MAELHDLSVDTQNSVLNYLADRNQQIFTLIIKEYILCLKGKYFSVCLNTFYYHYTYLGI